MLTPKQEKFCQHIVSGMTGKDSYYSAYDTTCNENTAYKEAMKLLARDDIQARLTELRKPLELQARTTAISEREKKRQWLWDMIENPEVAESDRLRAMDLLNKMDSEYTNINVNQNDTTLNLGNIDLSTLRNLSE